MVNASSAHLRMHISLFRIFPITRLQYQDEVLQIDPTLCYSADLVHGIMFANHRVSNCTPKGRLDEVSETRKKKSRPINRLAVKSVYLRRDSRRVRTNHHPKSRAFFPLRDDEDSPTLRIETSSSPRSPATKALRFPSH